MDLRNFDLEHLMNCALEQAKTAYALDEVPIGAVVGHCKSGRIEIISAAHNKVEQLRDPTAHAELLAIKEATKALGNWRLSDCILVVTLEPCAMCAGAIRLARIPSILFGTDDERLGAFGSMCDLSEDPCYGPLPCVTSGVKKEECAQLLRNFFRDRRDHSKLARFWRDVRVVEGA